MFTKWTKKEIITAVISFIVFFVLILLTQLPGFLSPLYWCLFPIFAAFFAAGPITYFAAMKRGIGSAVMIPLLWFLLYKLMGEFGMTMMWVGVLIVLIAGETIHILIGCEKLASIRASVPVLCLAPSCNLLPLYFQKKAFLNAALEEMEQSYVDGLARYGHIWMFCIVTVLCIAAATVSERFTEKLLKITED
mgnify:CR=1 FL=1